MAKCETNFMMDVIVDPTYDAVAQSEQSNVSSDQFANLSAWPGILLRLRQLISFPTLHDVVPMCVWHKTVYSEHLCKLASGATKEIPFCREERSAFALYVSDWKKSVDKAHARLLREVVVPIHGIMKEDWERLCTREGLSEVLKKAIREAFLELQQAMTSTRARLRGTNGRREDRSVEIMQRFEDMQIW